MKTGMSSTPWDDTETVMTVHIQNLSGSQELVIKYCRYVDVFTPAGVCLGVFGVQKEAARKNGNVPPVIGGTFLRMCVRGAEIIPSASF